jgi:hypothetical protein
LVTGKAEDEDGVPVSCHLTANKPVFLLHGAANDFDNNAMLDIRGEWSRS